MIIDLQPLVAPPTGGDGDAARQRDLDPLPQASLDHMWNDEHVQVVLDQLDIAIDGEEPPG
jgi:hypothetical protein